MGNGRRGYGSVVVQKAFVRERAVAKYIEERTKETGIVDEEKLKIQIEAFRVGWNTCSNYKKRYKPKKCEVDEEKLKIQKEVVPVRTIMRQM